MFGVDDALLIGGATLGSSLIGADAASGAAKTQADATNRATAVAQGQYDTTRADQAPYRAAGTAGLARLQQLLGFGGGGTIDQNDPRYRALVDAIHGQNDAAHQQQFGMSIFDPRSGLSAPGERAKYDDRVNSQAQQQFTSQYGDPAQTAPGAGDLNRKFSVSDFWNDPVVQASYQSGLDLGTKALKNAAPLTTGLDSGAAMKELTKFGTDYTGNMAAGAQARFVGDQGNQFNRLAAMAGIGQTSTGQTAAAGAGTAANVSSLISGQGNAAGAAKIAGANAWGGGLQSVANWWQGQNMMNQLKAQPYTFNGTYRADSNGYPGW